MGRKKESPHPAVTICLAPDRPSSTKNLNPLAPDRSSSRKFNFKNVKSKHMLFSLFLKRDLLAIVHHREEEEEKRLNFLKGWKGG